MVIDWMWKVRKTGVWDDLGFLTWATRWKMEAITEVREYRRKKGFEGWK